MKDITHSSSSMAEPTGFTSGVQACARAVGDGAGPSRTTLISIGSPAHIALLEPTYAYLSSYCASCLAPASAERLSVALYELLANAFKYGSSAGELRLELHQLAAGTELSISNYALPRDILSLSDHLNRVRDNPEAAFAEQMRRMSGDEASAPTLGIVRVLHESALDLVLRIDGDRVTLTALCPG